MAVARLEVPPSVHSQLGDDAVRDIAANVHAGDCQGCGKPLGRQTPRLAVAHGGWYLYALLHHPTCPPPLLTGQAPENDPFALTMKVHSLLLCDGDRSLPMLVVNPTLEAALLTRHPELAQWRVDTGGMFASKGLHRFDPDAVYTPIPRSRARMTRPADGTDPRVVVHIAGSFTWEAVVAPFISTHMQRLGGVSVVVTSLIDPTSTPLGKVPVELLQAILHTGQCAVGWVPLTGSAPAAPHGSDRIRPNAWTSTLTGSRGTM